MQVHFEVIPHVLKFRFEAGTSRGSFTEKETWFIKANTQAKPAIVGWGEASPLKGLSLDYLSDYEVKLKSQLASISKLDFPEEAESLLRAAH